MYTARIMVWALLLIPGAALGAMSFGGLNSACFGLEAHESFGGIGMQSPAMHPVDDLFSRYRKAPKRDMKIFLSTGTKSDNEGRTRTLKGILQHKGYAIHYVEVPYGHNWNNWGPLLDDALIYFFGTENSTR